MKQEEIDKWLSLLPWVEETAAIPGLSGWLGYTPVQGPAVCSHEYVDAGFTWPKHICKFCDEEKPQC